MARVRPLCVQGASSPGAQSLTSSGRSGAQGQGAQARIVTHVEVDVPAQGTVVKESCPARASDLIAVVGTLQLGKTPRADGANDGELVRQVSEPTDYGERLRRAPDAR